MDYCVNFFQPKTLNCCKFKFFGEFFCYAFVGHNIFFINLQTEIIDDGMALNKNEFMTLGMLYASTVDGNIKFEEVKVMVEKFGFERVDKIGKLFAKISDAEVLECMRESKAQYTSTVTHRLDLIHDLCAIIEADEKCMVMKEKILNDMRRLLDWFYK